MQIEISMKFNWFLLIAFFLIISGCCKTYQCKQDYYQITYDDLENKIQGGLLYGQGDFAESLRIIFNFGWDADCNAATAGTILGVMKGREWMMEQGLEVEDRYSNATRDEMPEDENITSYGDRLVDLAEKVILKKGGEKIETSGNITYRIPAEPVNNNVKLKRSLDNLDELKSSMRDPIFKTITDDTGEKKEWAQAVYYAISLEIAEELKTTFPDEWARAVEALDDYPDAEKIVIYGNFTNYSKFETIFGKENAKWVCRVDLNPGIYNYLFLIINRDGTQEWLPDPNNPDQQRHIDGYYYSFLEVK